jgi:two-component system sensor histidine kinase DesK
VDTRRGPYAATRVLPVAFVVTLLLSRTFDVTTHADRLYLPCVLALYVLPLWYASGLARGPWRTAPLALLAAQAVVTYLPFVLLGNGWAGGASGMLIGLVVLVTARPWLLALSLLVVEGVLWNVVVGPPFPPAVNGGIWAVIAATNGALALFGLVRLAETVGELDATQDELAGAAVLRERLAVGERLVGLVEDRIQLVARHARAALRWLSTTPEDARGEIAAAGRVAREAVSEGRRLHADDRDRIEVPDQATSTTTTPGLARAVLATGLILYGVQDLLNVVAPTPGLAQRGYDRPVAIVVAVLVSVASPTWVTASSPSPGGSPRAAPGRSSSCSRSSRHSRCRDSVPGAPRTRDRARVGFVRR